MAAGDASVNDYLSVLTHDDGAASQKWPNHPLLKSR